MKKRTLTLFFVFLLLLAFTLVSYLGENRKTKYKAIDDSLQVAVFEHFKFDSKDSLKKWKNKIFKRKTNYWIDTKNNETFLLSESQNTSSALYRLINYDSHDFPSISWMWRPVEFPDKKHILNKKLKDDYALRFSIVFAKGFFTNFKCIEYLWDESLKIGTVITSPYSDNIKQIIVNNGPGDGNWVTQQRNIIQDYKNLFGHEPKMNVRAIAIMSDSEGCKSSCKAHFKEIKIFGKFQGDLLPGASGVRINFTWGKKDKVKEPQANTAKLRRQK